MRNLIGCLFGKFNLIFHAKKTNVTQINIISIISIAQIFPVINVKNDLMSGKCFLKIT